MLPIQGTIHFSDYSSLYDIVVPKNNKLRLINELVDFSFIYEELNSKYCQDNGRMAEDPVRMFKYLMIKSISGLSDVDLVDKCMCDMSYKYFLGLAPEDRVIESSTLSKFRRMRLKDMNLLDMLINKSIDIAREKGIEISNKIIVDSTHSLSRSNPILPANALQKQAKILRKSVYEADPDMKDKMPQKYEGADLEKQMDYVSRLLALVREQKISILPSVSEKINLLSEMIEDIKDHYTVSADPDARTGHKTPTSDFFGFKGHYAVVPEHLVVAATITSGEKGDGPELPTLISKAKVNIPNLEEVIGDGAYSSQKNLENADREGVSIIAKLNPIIANGNIRESSGKFTYNKDAGMVVCPAGHMAIHKYLKDPSTKKKRKNLQYRFIFDAHKCKVCNHTEECGYKGSGRKEYCITILTKQQEELKRRQETKEFQEKYRERYIVESKNSELKHPYHLNRAFSYGLNAFTMQSAVAIFASNLVRINRILDNKNGK